MSLEFGMMAAMSDNCAQDLPANGNKVEIYRGGDYMPRKETLHEAEVCVCAQHKKCRGLMKKEEQ